MASPRRNLPAFTEIAERVALLESIRSSPSAVPAHYANILEDIAVVLRKWSGLAPAIAANPEAAALVVSVRRAFQAVVTQKGYTMSSAVRDFFGLHLALARINPSFHLSATSSPVVTYKDTHPTGPVCFIFLLFSLFPNLIFLQRVPRGHIAGKGKRIDPLETASAPAGTSEDTDIEVCTYEFFKVSRVLTANERSLGHFLRCFWVKSRPLSSALPIPVYLLYLPRSLARPRSVASRLRVAFLPA